MNKELAYEGLVYLAEFAGGASRIVPASEVGLWERQGARVVPVIGGSGFDSKARTDSKELE